MDRAGPADSLPFLHCNADNRLLVVYAVILDSCLLGTPVGDPKYDCDRCESGSDASVSAVAYQIACRFSSGQNPLQKARAYGVQLQEANR